MRDAYASFGGATVDALPDFEDGFRAAVLTEAGLSSARTGSWTSVRVTAAAGEAAA